MGMGAKGNVFGDGAHALFRLNTVHMYFVLHGFYLNNLEIKNDGGCSIKATIKIFRLKTCIGNFNGNFKKISA
jgi:hypothetical protein